MQPAPAIVFLLQSTRSAIPNRPQAPTTWSWLSLDCCLKTISTNPIQQKLSRPSSTRQARSAGEKFAYSVQRGYSIHCDAAKRFSEGGCVVHQACFENFVRHRQGGKICPKQLIAAIQRGINHLDPASRSCKYNH